MSLFVASLNSGSNGNCYYVGNNDEAVLVDGGISRKETERRMKRLGLMMQNVKAIFITHEHADHTYGVSALSKKYEIPVYITPRTREESGITLKDDLVIPFRPNEPIRIGALSVTPFPTIHDAADPHNFVVASETARVGIFTDIGFACAQVRAYFQQCHAAFLESNYDEMMLETGMYPPALKDRIRGGKGHLSNVQALQLFLDNRPPFMTHLFLSHLSQHNNTQKIVRSLFSSASGNTEIVIASRYKNSRLYQIRNLTGRLTDVAAPRTYSQLSLFS